MNVKCTDGEFPAKFTSESVRQVKGRRDWSDCRPGAFFLNRSREERVSPLQLLSVRFSGNSGGTAESFSP